MIFIAGAMRDYAHPAMFKALNASFDHYASLQNCEAGFIGFRYTVDIMTNIVEPWRDCALRKECIAPEGSEKRAICLSFVMVVMCQLFSGSSRANHRQDQSVITYLLHHANISLSTDRNYASDCVYIKCDTDLYAFTNWFGRYPNMKLFQWFCI